MEKEILIPVEICGITFKNPFYVASGPTTKSVKQLLRIEETGWAAASIKLTIDPAPYINRAPRYAVFKDRDALAFTAEKRLDLQQGLRLVSQAKKALRELLLMANITYAGDRGAEGWVNMARRFEEAGADIIELNMCCPNMSYNLELTSGSENACGIRTGASLGQQEEAISEIVREIKKAVRLPLFVKLTPEGGRIARVAGVLYEAGADAVGGTGNRLAIPPINLDEPGKAVYHLQDEISMSCHSGAWLKPLAQRDTYEIRKVNGPGPRITATGGIRSHTDAIEMVMCGGDLLGICAETLMSGYDFIRPLIRDMKSWMDEHGYKDLMEVRDLIVPKVKTAPELTLYKGYARIKEPKLSAPCKAACPQHVPAQAYVRKVAERDFKAAFDLIIGAAPLQRVCGFVCNHACEDECTRNEYGRPVGIRDIKRFVLEYGRERGWKPDLQAGRPNGKKAAVVGSGPAGISNAYYLAKAGYEVTVFERENEPGGMLRYLPSFRLPREAVGEEIEVLKALGVKIRTNCALGRDVSIASLKNDGYEVIFLATGAQKGKSLGIPGEKARGVLQAVEFLKKAAGGENAGVGGTVVVAGGGMEAVDAARIAARLGAGRVYIVYQSAGEESSAVEKGIAEAVEEGIKVMPHALPVSLEIEGGRVSAVTLCSRVHCMGAEETEENVFFTLPCDTVIAAVGRQAEELPGIRSDEGFIAVDRDTLSTDIPGVYAGGDGIKASSVIAAVAEGHKAAGAMDRLLSGDGAAPEYGETGPVTDKESVLKRTGYFKDKEGEDLITAPGELRVKGFEPYTRTMTEEEAANEASRCLACGCGEGCGLCRSICNDFAIGSREPDVLKIFRYACVACGMCFNRCPAGNIEMVNTGEKA